MTIAPERPLEQEPLRPERTNWTLVIILMALIAGLVVAIAVVVSNDDDEPSTSGERISGSGTVVVEDRAVGDLDAVSLFSSGRIIITQGSDTSLSVEADDNLLAYIQTDVRGGTLEIGAERDGRSYNLDPSDEIIYRLGVADLSQIEVFGAGTVEVGPLTLDTLDVRVMGSADVTLDALTADRLDIEVPGSADLRLSGVVPEQTIRWMGAGTYDGTELQSESAEVDMLGAASIDLWVTDSLDVTITGAGTVRYYGTPSVDQTVTGVGSVKSLGAK
ncbi:MAG: DUF2807 domain-containing protein [Acidimicrobiia bacterium]|nr:DUF2807 domain-containing protein [Acidimicrobiia bacterium]